MSSTIPYLLPRQVEEDLMYTPTSWLTDARVKMMNDMSAILAGVGLFLCLLLLGFIAVLYVNKEARKSLDRVSFRLICYSLISNCFYSIGYIICVEVGPGFFCVAGVWMIQFWQGITNWLITCVALNLELVLVHLFNGIVLEKYYVMGTLALNLAITLPPLIKGKFGWDDVIGVCWLTSEDNEDRLIWQISTQLLWILLAVFITFTCCLTTIYHLYKHKFNALSVLAHKPGSTGGTTDSANRPGSPADRSSYSPSKTAQRSLLSSQEFRSIILRISLYPAVMIIVNLVITIADIRISVLSGIYSEGDYALYALYYALYGARGIFYALIAVMDPSLQRAYHVWRGERMHSSTLTGTVGNGTYNDTNDPENIGVSVQDPAEQPEFGNVINVQTEITSQVHETNLDYKINGDIPMTTLANPHTLTMTKTVIEGNHANKDVGHTFFDSRRSLEMPEPALRRPGSKEDIKRVTHWTDLRSDYEASMQDLPDDSSSEAGLAHHGNKSSDSIDYMKADVEGIRLRQRARAQQRRLLEKEMKRQI